MKRLVYNSPFVPAEWVAAHGFAPGRPLPTLRDNSPPVEMGACAYAHAFLSMCAPGQGEATVFDTACDQMRRAAERAQQMAQASIFLLHVPKTWQTTGAHRLYQEELRRLGRFMVSLGGVAPSNAHLAEIMDRYDVARAQIRAARGQLSPREHAEALAALWRDGPRAAAEVSARARDAGVEMRRRGVPIALVGGPAALEHLAWHDAIEAAGAWVALDATPSGELGLPRPFDRRRLTADPFGELADAYFGHIPGAFRRPNSALYVFLRRELSARGVRGILFRQYVWCDTWRAEARRLAEWAKIPLLAVDVDDAVGAGAVGAGAAGARPGVEGRLMTRIEAFVEALR